LREGVASDVDGGTQLDEDVHQAKTSLYNLIVDAEERVKEMKSKGEKISHVLLQLQSMNVETGGMNVMHVIDYINSFVTGQIDAAGLDVQVKWR
jgi:hypothetical protein